MSSPDQSCYGQAAVWLLRPTVFSNLPPPVETVQEVREVGRSKKTKYVCNDTVGLNETLSECSRYIHIYIQYTQQFHAQRKREIPMT